jgi:hypothetical protein
MTKPTTIYRCGWCGYPVGKDGEYLSFVNDPDDASEYLKQNAAAEVVKVNGVCCPEGDYDTGQYQNGLYHGTEF